MDETKAHEGCTWLCMACGKTNSDQRGMGEGTRGWDVSCALHAIHGFFEGKKFVLVPHPAMQEIK